VTRARKLAVLVGSKRALAMAIKNGPDQIAPQPSPSSSARSRPGAARYTGLAIRLAQAM
jgi:hypothetical protein